MRLIPFFHLKSKALSDSQAVLVTAVFSGFALYISL